MFAFLLQCSCSGEQFLFGDICRRENICNAGFAAGDRTGLVQCYDLNLAGFLQRNRGFEQDSVLGSDTVSHHNGNWCSKSQCTGATDDQHGNAPCQSISHGLSHQQPYHNCDNSNGNDSRYKHTGNLVCDLGNGSLGGSGIADHANDLGKRSIFSHTCGFTPEKTGLVDRGS